MSARDRSETVVLLVVWVVPLLAASALLAAAGLPLLGGALLAVEGLVGLCVWAARRRPARVARPTPPWLVPAVMLAVVAALAALSLVAASLG